MPPPASRLVLFSQTNPAKGKMMANHNPVMDEASLEAFFAGAFPEMAAGGKRHHVVSVSPGAVRLRLDADAGDLRPGGTISGPVMFALADYAAYAVILAHAGPVALAVTTSAHIDFLRKPAPGILHADAMLMKLGKRLAVVAITLTDASGQCVAQASMTYSLPPETVPALPMAR
jgi:uncharacterized protein (TIGR00369 family)